MTLIDYQLHTNFSDGKASPEKMVRTAESMGLTEVAITDHLILSDRIVGPGIVDLSAYFDRIDRLRELSSIAVRIGLEVDYFPGKETKLEEMLSNSPLDFVLLSVHYPGNRSISSPDHTRSHQEIAKSYYDWWSRSIDAALEYHIADSIGHADYFKRWTIPLFGAELKIEDQIPLIKTAVHNLVNSNLCIDFNTSGFRHEVNIPYPSLPFLKFCLSQGARKFTLSSDAHQPDQIGHRLTTATQILLDLGVEEIYTFKGRRSVRLPLSSL